MFSKNIERWAAVCPGIEDKLAKELSSRDKRSLFLCLADPGVPNIKYVIDGKESYIHSQKDPVAEAKEWFEKLNLDDIEVVYVYGIGLGYCYEAAREWLRANKNHFIVFLEEDPEVVDCFLKTNRCTDFFNDGQAFLYFLENEDAQPVVFNELVLCFLDKKYVLTALESWIKKYPKEYQLLSSKLSFFFSMNRQWLVELQAHGGAFFRNCFLNYLDLPRSYLGNGLFGKFKGVPAIICGAGPSLDKNIDLLKNLTERALIFAGGTALNALNAKNIMPHFGVGIDPNPPQFTRLIMNEAYELPFFYRVRMLSEALKVVHGDKLYVRGSGGYVVTKWLEDHLKIDSASFQDNAEVIEGFNVLNFSVSLAHALGCDPIICVGIDLAYGVDGTSYAERILSHPIHNRKDDFKTRNFQEQIVTKNNIYGQPVNTLWKWLAESSWYTQCLERFRGTKFINATEGGIGFLSIDNMALKDVASTYLTKQRDLTTLIDGEIQNSHLPDGVTEPKVRSVLKILQESLERCNVKLQAIVGLYGKEALRAEEEPSYEKEIEKSLEKLRQEDAYGAILEVFDSAHKASSILPLKQLKLAQEKIEEKEWRLRHSVLKGDYYRLFSLTAQANAWLIQQILNAIPQRQSEDFFTANIVADSIEEMTDSLESESTFYEDGKLKSRQCYKANLLHGPSIFYSKKGTLIVKGMFIDGKREGVTNTYYANGQIHSRQLFEKGVRAGEQNYLYPNGSIKSVIPYRNGKLDGRVLLNHPNGKPFRLLGFVMGERDGLEQMWDEEGVLRIECNYCLGTPVGVTRSWHSNGLIAKEIIYDDKGISLEEKRWDSNGDLIIDEGEFDGDYFDNVNFHSRKLTESLDENVKNIANVNLNEQLQVLKEEMERLKMLEAVMTSQLAADNAAVKEDLWKNPQTQELIEGHLKDLQKQMDVGMKSMQEAMAIIMKNKPKF